MMEFTFDSLFRTTNKGLPDTSSLDPYSYITMNHFIILALVITIYTALSAYRVFYRIKNPKFNSLQQEEEEDQQQQDVSDQQQKDMEIDSKRRNAKDGLQAEETNNNLIYRFDEDNNDGQEEQGENESKQEQVQQTTQQTIQWYLSIDHKMLFLQPFLISFVVVVNIFASNIIVVVLLGLSLIMFYLFNIKNYCNNKKILQLFFTLPCIAVLVIVFFQDLDMST